MNRQSRSLASIGFADFSPDYSIPTAISALTSLASTIYTPYFTEDPLAFRSESLGNYAAVVFLSNSQALGANAEQILDTEGQQALNDWLGKGGALVGLHSGCAVQFNERELTCVCRSLIY